MPNIVSTLYRDPTIPIVPTIPIIPINKAACCLLILFYFFPNSVLFLPNFRYRYRYRYGYRYRLSPPLNPTVHC